jgi:hypothetical protein
MYPIKVTRRACLIGAGFAVWAARAQQGPLRLAAKDDDAGDWVCPMDPDVRSKQPGVCPRCGMKLVRNVPERVNYQLEVTHDQEQIVPHQPCVLRFRAFDPRTGEPATKFEIVHERLMHLFLVSEDLEYFRHDHPVLQPDGSFLLPVTFERGGMHRLLADFYPTGSVPQLAYSTLYASGDSTAAHLEPSLAPSKSVNLAATLRVEPEQLLAGFETRLTFDLEPREGVEPYLGAWGHMLAASEDVIDLLHAHPYLTDGEGTMQFNLIFPRPGMYKIWTQFQRLGVVNTVVFVLPVAGL